MIPSLPREPWRSIGLALAVPDLPPPDDTPAEDLCLSCRTSPCCWTAPLLEFQPETMADLDRVRYWLGFDRLIVVLWRRGTWSLAWREPCGHLNRETSLCGLHGHPDKPLICQSYSPVGCTYRANMIAGGGPDLLQLDARRFRRLLDRVRVDAQGRVASLPTFDEVAALVAPVDLLDIEAPVPEPRADLAGLLRPRSPRPGLPDGAPARTLKAWDSPCDGCRAPCCETVLIPYGRPTDGMGVDYLAFLLGFPGLSLGLSDDDGWALIAHTRCRHFDPDGAVCTLYGSPERPGVCVTYDAWRCGYVTLAEPTQLAELLAVDAGTYRTVRGLMPLDEDGRVAAWPTRRECLEALLEDADQAPAGGPTPEAQP